jgi:hypothetical protein
MPANFSAVMVRAISLDLVDKMFRELDRREKVVASKYEKMRRKLGLPAYQFAPDKVKTVSARFALSKEPVTFVFVDSKRGDFIKSLEEPSQTITAQEGPPSKDWSDDKCLICSRDKWDGNCNRKNFLCTAPAVHYHISIVGFRGVLQRNKNPYGPHHGLIRSEDHEKQETWTQKEKLDAALHLANILGSNYEVWIAGLAFNTVEHFHIQFRRKRTAIWQYLEHLEQSNAKPGPTLDMHPSRPVYLSSDRHEDAWGLLDQQLHTKPFRDAPADGGLMLRFGDGKWRMLLVASRKDKNREYSLLEKRRMGLLEHLGEVILEDETIFDGVEANLLTVVEDLRRELDQRYRAFA